MMVRYCLLLLVGLSATAGPAGPAVAHPHAWIDLASALVFDGAGRATGIRQVWLLDEYYTAYAAQGRDRDGDGVPDPDQLAELLALNLANLQAYDYFTRATHATARLAFAAPRDAASRMVGRRLEMAFYLPFADPVTIGASGLSYAVFDPTYYIELLHTETDVAVQLPNAPAGCRSTIRAPNPDANTVALAAALDRTQTAGDTLGAFFAETVIVRCD